MGNALIEQIAGLTTFMSLGPVGLLAVLASVSAFLVVSAAWRLAGERRRRRAMEARTAWHRIRVEAAPVRPGSGGGLAALVAGLFTRCGESMKPKDEEELSQTRLMLIQAGYRRGNTVAVYWGIRSLLTLLALLLFLAAYTLVLKTMPLKNAVIAGLSLMVFFLYLPAVWLRMRINARKDRMGRGLPDMLDLLVVCVEAGMGLDAALQRVAAEIRLSCPDLSDELKLLNLELRAGKTRRDALKSLAARIGLEDMHSLVALLIQADIFGTSVAQTLRVYADTMRVKRQQRAEELAAKLPVKLLLPLIFFILPPLFIVIMGPGVLRLMKTMAAMR